MPGCQLGALILGDGRERVLLSLTRDGNPKEWMFMPKITLLFLPECFYLLLCPTIILSVWGQRLVHFYRKIYRDPELASHSKFSVPLELFSQEQTVDYLLKIKGSSAIHYTCN